MARIRMGCPGIRRLILDIEDYLHVTIGVGTLLKGSLLGLDDLFLEAASIAAREQVYPVWDMSTSEP